MLSLILLAIIGYAGYRIYPPWWICGSAHMSPWKHRQFIPNAAPTAPAATSAAPDAKPETSPTPPQRPSARRAGMRAPVAGGKSSCRRRRPNRRRPGTGENHRACRCVASGTENAPKDSQNQSRPQKPVVPAPIPSGECGRIEIAIANCGPSLVADKVKTQVTANTVTLSGRLAPREHRELLNHLHWVPAGVRIIDDLEYTDDLKETPRTGIGGLGLGPLRTSGR